MNISGLNIKFSVITVCYNSSTTIKKTLESVLNQTYKNYEYIVVDGGSTDGTQDIVRSYNDAFGGRLTLISEKDKGIYDAMNKGIKMSTGDIVSLLNSDDSYTDTTLETVALLYDPNDPFTVIDGALVKISDTDKEIKTYYYTKEHEINRKYIGHPTMFVAKCVYDKLGLYDISYSLAADFDWQCRAFIAPEVNFIFSNEIFTYVREGGATDMLKYRWKWFKQVSDIKIKYKIETPIVAWTKGVFVVLKKDIKVILPKAFVKKIYSIIK